MLLPLGARDACMSNHVKIFCWSKSVSSYISLQSVFFMPSLIINETSPKFLTLAIVRQQSQNWLSSFSKAMSFNEIISFTMKSNHYNISNHTEDICLTSHISHPAYALPSPCPGISCYNPRKHMVSCGNIQFHLCADQGLTSC